MGKIEKRTRIKLAVELNNWIRAPGIILAWSFAYGICAVILIYYIQFLL